MADATHYLDDDPEVGFELTTGMVISGVAHVGLLTWLLAGWGLSQEPLPFETVDVSVVSSADYAALVNRGNPEIDPTEPAALTTPEVETAPTVTPEVPVVPLEAETAPEIPVEELPPEALDPVPVPEEVTDEVATLQTPVIPETPVVPDLPVEETAQEEAAPRVAPEVAPLPPLEADVAPEVQLESSPDAESAEVVEEEQEAAAPEQAATEIVTEAEEPSSAPETSLRPLVRPARPQPVVEETPEETPVETEVATQTPVEDTTLEDVLADVAAEETSQPAAQEVAGDPGPPMTGGERDAFRIAVQGCWVVDTGSQAANVTVTVTFSLGRDARVAGDVEMVSNSGGPNAAVTAAFDAARRAVLRCQGGGFPLPPEKYEQWRNVEMTFNPTEMRIR